MPNINKSAAVPFVNQKGERSMKRVKVERYVAGKRPAYAKDEEEEYYTTDEGEDEMDDESPAEGSDDDSEDRPRKPINLEPEHDRAEQAGSSSRNFGRQTPTTPPPQEEDKRTIQREDNNEGDEDEDEDDEEDDPRFRRLKQLELRPETKHLLQAQTTSRVFAKVEDKPRIVEDEEEDEIKLRHTLARARTLEELIETRATLQDFPEQQVTGRDSPDIQEGVSRRDETEDLLDKIVITRIKPEEETRKIESVIEEQSKLFIEQAKQESELVAQVHQKIKEDNERELEIESRKKGGLSATEMESVKTDDEDEEIAYEEWKLREIKRVLRDRSERALETRARI